MSGDPQRCLWFHSNSQQCQLTWHPNYILVKVEFYAFDQSPSIPYLNSNCLDIKKIKKLSDKAEVPSFVGLLKSSVQCKHLLLSYCSYQQHNNAHGIVSFYIKMDLGERVLLNHIDIWAPCWHVEEKVSNGKVFQRVPYGEASMKMQVFWRLMSKLEGCVAISFVSQKVTDSQSWHIIQVIGVIGDSYNANTYISSQIGWLEALDAFWVQDKHQDAALKRKPVSNSYHW